MIFQISENEHTNDLLNALALSPIVVFGRLGIYHLLDHPPLYDNQWYLIVFELLFFVFWFWVVFAFCSQKRSEFEAEQAYYRRRGRAAVLRQQAEEEDRRKRRYGPRSFSRRNLGLK